MPPCKRYFYKDFVLHKKNAQNSILMLAFALRSIFSSLNWRPMPLLFHNSQYPSAPDGVYSMFLFFPLLPFSIYLFYAPERIFFIAKNYLLPFLPFLRLFLGKRTLTAFKYSLKDSSPSPSAVCKLSPNNIFICDSKFFLP